MANYDDELQNTLDELERVRSELNDLHMENGDLKQERNELLKKLNAGKKTDQKDEKLYRFIAAADAVRSLFKARGRPPTIIKTYDSLRAEYEVPAETVNAE